MSNELEMNRLRHKILTMLPFEERMYIQPLLDKCLMFATEESRPQGDLISRSALKKAIEEVQYTQEFCIEHQIDYSVSMQMLGMVINNAPTVEPKLSDEQIDKITDLLETEWGYEGIREDVSRILRGGRE